MAPRDLAVLNTSGAGRVRARILTALHVGKLRPGDRVLSVRRLADLTGVNRKTVHRAYRTLARDGILEVRPGSGTFVTERRSCAEERPSASGLLSAIDRFRFEARRLGLMPEALSRFLTVCLTDGLRGVPVGLVECNDEQIAMIGRDIGRALGVDVRPILLDRLERDPARALDCVESVVTTDCHWALVSNLLEPLGVPAYTVTLDQRFPRELLHLSRRNEIVVVAKDPRFGGVFRRLLTQLADDADRVSRIKCVVEREAGRVLRTAAAGTCVYFSPLVSSVTLRRIRPLELTLVEGCWHVETSAIEALHVGLGLDQTLRRDPAEPRPGGYARNPNQQPCPSRGKNGTTPDRVMLNRD